jgi:hypothetical protein
MYRCTQHIRSLSVWGMFLVSMVVGISITPALEIGELAPDFTLPSTTGEKISLSQFRGKQHVLIEFYGQDFSPV